MLPIMAAVMLRARVPEARAALDAVRRRIGGRGGAEPGLAPHGDCAGYIVSPWPGHVP